MRYIAIALLCALMVGCGASPYERELVEVKIISHKTSEEFERKDRELYPHTVVEIVATGERIRMVHNRKLGEVGEVIKVKRMNLK